MQRHSEFPLFCQTAIALFGFLMLIVVFSSWSTPAANSHPATTAVEMTSR